MGIEKKINLATRFTEEIVTREELARLLDEKKHPRAYWGFECSGLMHLGMGLVCGLKIRDLIMAGFDVTIFLADWHSLINNKLDGDMEKIRLCGEYFKECFTAIGIEPESVNYVWASDITEDMNYWEKVIRTAKNISLQRTWRALPIMGRDMNLSDIETAWIFYPCMQAADIFHMDFDVACAGLDQRKVHMLARDVSERLGLKKPVCIHTHLLAGLRRVDGIKRQFDENIDVNLQITSKMSKSIPGSCIYIHDNPKEIEKKIKAAYCPPHQTRGNPVFDLLKYIVFAEKEKFEIRRSMEHGGSRNYQSYVEIEKDYLEGEIHPLDLKNSIIEVLIEILAPVRKHFRDHPKELEGMIAMGITK